MQSEEPAYLEVGTEISAKFKGAFCEARVKRIQKSVKCKVALKEAPFGNLYIEDRELVKGEPSVNAEVLVPVSAAGKTSARAVVVSVKDSSLYTVVFDDGDEKELRRTQICLKGAKHFANSDNLDTLPLTSPEHFGTPVNVKGKNSPTPKSSTPAPKPPPKAGTPAPKKTPKNKDAKDQRDGKKGRRAVSESSSEEESDEPGPKRRRDFNRSDTGTVVVVSEEGASPNGKKHQIAALIVPPHQDKKVTLKKQELLVRRFSDSEYMAVRRDALAPFVLLKARKMESGAAGRAGFDKAAAFVERKELPSGWAPDPALVRSASSESEWTGESDSEAAESDRFVAQLYKFHEEKGTPINKAPVLGGKDLNIYKFYRVVARLGGFNKVCNQSLWRKVLDRMGLEATAAPSAATVKNCYSRCHQKYLQGFDSVFRQLGWAMGEGSRRATPRTRRPPPAPARAKTDARASSSSSAASSTKEKKPEATPPPGLAELAERSLRKSGRDRSGSDGSDRNKEEKKSVVRAGSAEGDSTEDEEEGRPMKREEGPPLALVIGQRIKALYGSNEANRHWYDAKVLQIDSGGGRFFIHYMGWKRRFDEWVSPDRVQVLGENEASQPVTNKSGPPKFAIANPATSSSAESTDEGKAEPQKETTPPKTRRPPSDISSDGESSATESKAPALVPTLCLDLLQRRVDGRGQGGAPEGDDPAQDPTPALGHLFGCAESTDEGKAEPQKETTPPKTRRPPSDISSDGESSATESKALEAKRRKMESPSPERMEAAEPPKTPVKEEVREEPPPSPPAPAPEDSSPFSDELKEEEEEEPARPRLTRSARRAAGEEETLDALPMYPRPKSRGTPRPTPSSAGTPSPLGLPGPIRVDPDDNGEWEEEERVCASVDSCTAESDLSPPPKDSDVGSGDSEEARLLDLAREDSTPADREDSETPTADGEDEGVEEEETRARSVFAGRGRGRGGRKRRRGGHSSGDGSRKNSVAKPGTPKKDPNLSSDNEEDRGDSTPARKDTPCMSPRDNLSALKARLQAEIESNPTAFPSRFNFTHLDPNLSSEERITAMAGRMEEIRDLYTQLKTQLGELDRKYRRALEKQSKPCDERTEIENEVAGFLAATGDSVAFSKDLPKSSAAS